MPGLQRLTNRLGPVAGPIAIIAAAVLFCVMPVIKVTRGHVDENGLLSDSFRPIAFANAPKTFARPDKGYCFTEHRIVGRRAPQHDAFYVVVNGGRSASLDTVNQAAAHWYVHRHRLASTVVVLIARNSSCLERVGEAIDPSFRVKAAVIVNTTSGADKMDSCLDVLSDWGTQPNHDFPLMAALLGQWRFTCPRSIDNAALEVVVNTARVVAEAVTGKELATERIQTYLAELRAMTVAFTRNRDARPRTSANHFAPISAFRLGVPGYPPAFTIRSASDKITTAPSPTDRPLHSALMLDKVLWSMNAMNERLHHSFAVWFPLSAHHFIENNAAQLQALIIVGGILASAYATWLWDTIRLRGPVGRASDATQATATDAAFIGLVSLVSYVAADVVGLELAVIAGASLLAGVAYRMVCQIRGAGPDVGAAVSPFAMVAAGTVIFSLTALSPSSSTVLSVGVGFLTLTFNTGHLPKGINALFRLVMVASTVVGVLVTAAFLADSESGSVAAAVGAACAMQAFRFG
jgi:hypothetical protein